MLNRAWAIRTEQRVSQLEQRTKPAVDPLDEIRARIEALAARLTSVSAEVDALNARLEDDDADARTMATLSDRIRALRTDMGARIDALEQRRGPGRPRKDVAP